MKEFTRSISGVVRDARVLVVLCGVLLSVVMHELFHMIVHWHHLRGVNFFPDSQAIIEIVFTHSSEQDLLLEEAIAYGITMTVLALSAKLVYEIHDACDTRSVKQTLIRGRVARDFPELHDPQFSDQLSVLLGVTPPTTQQNKLAQ